jgi:hypothetical protein
MKIFSTKSYIDPISTTFNGIPMQKVTIVVISNSKTI